MSHVLRHNTSTSSPSNLHCFRLPSSFPFSTSMSSGESLLTHTLFRALNAPALARHVSHDRMPRITSCMHPQTSQVCTRTRSRASGHPARTLPTLFSCSRTSLCFALPAMHPHAWACRHAHPVHLSHARTAFPRPRRATYTRVCWLFSLVLLFARCFARFQLPLGQHPWPWAA